MRSMKSEGKFDPGQCIPLSMHNDQVGSKMTMLSCSSCTVACKVF